MYKIAHCALLTLHDECVIERLLTPKIISQELTSGSCEPLRAPYSTISAHSGWTQNQLTFSHFRTIASAGIVKNWVTELPGISSDSKVTCAAVNFIKEVSMFLAYDRTSNCRFCTLLHSIAGGWLDSKAMHSDEYEFSVNLGRQSWALFNDKNI
jgi:hypothetical protein